MENFFDSELSAEKKAELIKKCDEYIEATQQILERIARDWGEIDRIDAETWTILALMRKAT